MALAANTVVISFGGKTFIGITSHSFNIAPEVTTSITRDGVTKKKTRFPYSGSIEAVAEIKGAGETSALDRNDAVDMVLSEDPVAIIYAPGTGGDSYTGSVLITSFNEKAGADDNVTFSLNFEDDGTELTATT